MSSNNIRRHSPGQIFAAGLLTAGALLLAAPAGIALAGPPGCGSGGTPDPAGGPPPPPGCGPGGTGNPSNTISGAVSAFQTQLNAAVTQLSTAAQSGSQAQIQAGLTQINTANTAFRNLISSIVPHH